MKYTTNVKHWLIDRLTNAEAALPVLREVKEIGPWVTHSRSGDEYEVCHWCEAYWGERFEGSGRSLGVKQDPHAPDCLWLKIEALSSPE